MDGLNDRSREGEGTRGQPYCHGKGRAPLRLGSAREAPYQPAAPLCPGLVARLGAVGHSCPILDLEVLQRLGEQQRGVGSAARLAAGMYAALTIASRSASCLKLPPCA